MADQGSTQPAETTAANKNASFRLGTQEWVVIALMVLSIIGIGVTDFAPAISHWYWLAMVPLFAVACLIFEWQRARGQGLSAGRIIRNQLLIWLGLLAAVQLVYLMLHAGRLDNENTGLIILLLLASTVFGSGIYLGWRLCIVAAFLGLALVMATYLEEFVWLLMIVLAVGAVVFYLTLRFRSGKANNGPTKQGE